MHILRCLQPGLRMFTWAIDFQLAELPGQMEIKMQFIQLRHSILFEGVIVMEEMNGNSRFDPLEIYRNISARGELDLRLKRERVKIERTVIAYPMSTGMLKDRLSFRRGKVGSQLSHYQQMTISIQKIYHYLVLGA